MCVRVQRSSTVPELLALFPSLTDILIGLLRLRKCSEETFRPELKGGVSVVRELHVYGSVVPVSARDPLKFQHQVYMPWSLYAVLDNGIV